jgi:mRNA interferase MazF
MVERGSVLIVSANGKLSGKPRPAIVIQESQFDFPETLIVVPLTSRHAAENVVMPMLLPDETNGLGDASRAMIHRISAIRKSDIGKVSGKLSSDDMAKIDAALVLVLGLART